MYLGHFVTYICWFSFCIQAHYQQRRAEVNLRHRKYDDAIECHQAAVKHLEEALNYATVPRSIESLKLQRDFHIKQQDIIRIKKEHENYQKAIENQRRLMQTTYANDYEDKQGNELMSIQIQLKIKEQDTLLQFLLQRDTPDSDVVDGESSSSNSVVITGRKCPKNDNTIIEELRILNQQLHSLVYQLVTQLDASSREAELLRARVKYLEGQRSKPDATTQNDTEPTRNNNLRIVTDSSGATSPYVFSPCSELSPDIGDAKTIPTLAPLELPAFDFSNLTKFSKS